MSTEPSNQKIVFSLHVRNRTHVKTKLQIYAILQTSSKKVLSREPSNVPLFGLVYMLPLHCTLTERRKIRPEQKY